MSGRHEPVLVAEALRFLGNGPGLYLDATLGDGGHAEALLDAEPEARLLGTDRDRAALESATARLARFGARVTTAHAVFRAIPGVHQRLGGELFAGALLDLGLSSRQIDDPARGISYRGDGPLDLRMDPSHGVSAAERLATVDEDTLTHVLREHGDLPGATRLARAMVTAARAGGLVTTGALAALVDHASGGHAHPRRLAQVFQALRMWINEESEDLEAVLDWLPGAMRPAGVVVTLAYHSGEDRRIKQRLKQAPLPPRRQPLAVGARSPEGPWEELTRSVVTPTDQESTRNPRARSARLRAFRRRVP